jgi:hypothetical protein
MVLSILLLDTTPILVLRKFLIAAEVVVAVIVLIIYRVN